MQQSVVGRPQVASERRARGILLRWARGPTTHEMLTLSSFYWERPQHLRLLINRRVVGSSPTQGAKPSHHGTQVPCCQRSQRSYARCDELRFPEHDHAFRMRPASPLSALEIVRLRPGESTGATFRPTSPLRRMAPRHILNSPVRLEGRRCARLSEFLRMFTAEEAHAIPYPTEHAIRSPKCRAASSQQRTYRSAFAAFSQLPAAANQGGELKW